MVTASFHENFTGKAFPRDTCKTFYFAIFFIFDTPSLYAHYIYSHYPHIERSAFREKTKAITLES